MYHDLKNEYLIESVAHWVKLTFLGYGINWVDLNANPRICPLTLLFANARALLLPLPPPSPPLPLLPPSLPLPLGFAL